MPTYPATMHRRGTPASSFRPEKMLPPLPQSYFQSLFTGSFKSRLSNFAVQSVVQSPMKLLNSLQLCANPRHGWCCRSSDTVISDGTWHCNRRLVEPARSIHQKNTTLPLPSSSLNSLTNIIILALTPESGKSRDTVEETDVA